MIFAAPFCSPAVYYVATSEQDCSHFTSQEECHNLSYYVDIPWPPNIKLIFLPGKHILTNGLNRTGLNQMFLSGQAMKGFGLPIINCKGTKKLEVNNATDVSFSDLEIYCDLHLTNVTIVVVNNASVRSLKVENFVEMGGILINNSHFQCFNCLKLTVDLSNAFVIIQDVVIAGGYGLLLYQIADNSYLINSTILQSDGFGFTLMYGNHIGITGLTVLGGDVNVLNNGDHILFSNVTVHAYHRFLVQDNGHYISFGNIAIYGGVMSLKGNGNYLTLHNITINGDQSNDTNEGITLSSNGGHIVLDHITIHNKELTLVSNGNGLLVTNVNIVGISYKIFSLYGNGNDISLCNITVALVSNPGRILLKSNGGNISVSNVTLQAASYQTNNISINSDSNGLVLVNNSDGITLKFIKVIGGSVLLSSNCNNIYISEIEIEGIEDVDGVLLYYNKNNITLSDIAVSMKGGINVRYNGDYITMKNQISVANGFIFVDYNGENISIFNVRLAGTCLVLFRNGNNITLANAEISKSIVGLLMQYNTGVITLDNVTLASNNIAMQVDGYNELRFLNNPSFIVNNTSPVNGAGMWIKDALVSSNTQVHFINNTAKGVGGAIYVDIIQLDAFIPQQRCTFQDFRPVFVHNTAHIAGNDVYNGRYWGCRVPGTITYANHSDTFLSSVNCTKNPTLKYFPTPLSSHITSIPIGVCLCTDDTTTNCNVRRISKQLYPGQSITLPLVTVGVCGGISPGLLMVSNTSTVKVLIDGNANHKSGRVCKNFKYQLKQNTPNNQTGKLVIRADFIGAEAQYNLINNSLMVNLRFLRCPIGLELIAGDCKCNQAFSRLNYIECNINWLPRPIKRSGSNWLYYSHDYNCTVAHKYCPFDYCNDSSLYLSLDEGDVQCANGRAGILCGGCQTGLSLMLGTNKCGICNDKYLGVLVGFIVSGMLLTVFLLALNLTVSLGSINGLLFYANIVKLNQAIIYSNSFRVPVLSQFVSWLNLDFGIQTCFFNGLDGYWKTWLQFVFPLYIWLLIGFLIIGSHYSGRLSRLCGNNAVPVLATLVLMSYTKLLQTITNVLMRDTIDCEGTAVWSVWSVDGNIGYLSGKHIPLFVVALLFLFIGLVYTGLVFSAQWLQRYSGKCCRSSRDPVVKLKPFIDAYTGPYKDKYRFWTGFFLIVRLILTPVFAYTTATVPQVNNYIIALVSFLAMYLSRSVYRSKVVNLLETFYLFNLGLLSLLSIFSNHMSLSTEATLFITTGSVSLCFIVFISTILAHIYVEVLMKRSFSLSCACKVFRSTERNQLQEQLIEAASENYSPSRVIMKRDSIIFDFSPNF